MIAGTAAHGPQRTAPKLAHKHQLATRFGPVVCGTHAIRIGPYVAAC